MLANVQEWQALPGANFGWAIVGTEFQSKPANRFASRTSPTVSNRPVLVVDYVPVPEPSAFTTLMLAAFSLGSTRRRGQRCNG